MQTKKTKTDTWMLHTRVYIRIWSGGVDRQINYAKNVCVRHQHQQLERYFSHVMLCQHPCNNNSNNTKYLFYFFSCLCFYFFCHFICNCLLNKYFHERRRDRRKKKQSKEIEFDWNEWINWIQTTHSLWMEIINEWQIVNANDEIIKRMKQFFLIKFLTGVVISLIIFNE